MQDVLVPIASKDEANLTKNGLNYVLLFLPTYFPNLENQLIFKQFILHVTVWNEIEIYTVWSLKSFNF